MSIQFYFDSSLFYRFWAYYPHLFTESHLMTVTKFMLFLHKFDYVYFILNSNTTHRIFLNSTETFRRDFVGLFNEQTLAQYEKREDIITAVTDWHPYRILERGVNDERLQHIHSLIKDNEVDHLRANIEGSGVAGIAHLRFDFVEYDENVLELGNNERLTVSQLNPILLAIRHKSFACLNYLVETFGLRQCMRYGEILVIDHQYGEFPYKNALLPLLAKVEDIQALDLILKQDGFVLTTQDFNSFVS